MTLAELIAAAQQAGFIAFCARGAPTEEEPLNMHDHDQLNRIERMLERLLQLTIEKDRTIMLDISNLTAAVTKPPEAPASRFAGRGLPRCTRRPWPRCSCSSA